MLSNDMNHAFLFGLSEDTWLIIAVAFLGLSALSFIWVWWRDLLRDRKSATKTDYPWD